MNSQTSPPRHQSDTAEGRGLRWPHLASTWIVAAVVFQLTPWPGLWMALAVAALTSSVCYGFFYLGLKTSLSRIALGVGILIVSASALCGWRPLTEHLTTTQLYRVEILGTLAAGLGFASRASREGNSMFTRDGAVGLIALLISVASTVTFVDSTTQPEQAHVTFTVDNAAPPGASSLTYRAPGAMSGKTLTSLDGSFSLALPYPEDMMSFKAQYPVGACGDGTCWRSTTLDATKAGSYSPRRAWEAFVNVITLGTVRDDNAPEVHWGSTHGAPSASN